MMECWSDGGPLQAAFVEITAKWCNALVAESRAQLTGGCLAWHRAALGICLELYSFVTDLTGHLGWKIFFCGAIRFDWARVCLLECWIPGLVDCWPARRMRPQGRDAWL